MPDVDAHEQRERGERFAIRWSTHFGAYRVGVPNLDDCEVVRADLYDALAARLAEVERELAAMRADRDVMEEIAGRRHEALGRAREALESARRELRMYGPLAAARVAVDLRVALDALPAPTTAEEEKRDGADAIQR